MVTNNGSTQAQHHTDYTLYHKKQTECARDYPKWINAGRFDKNGFGSKKVSPEGIRPWTGQGRICHHYLSNYQIARKTKRLIIYRKKDYGRTTKI